MRRGCALICRIWLSVCRVPAVTMANRFTIRILGGYLSANSPDLILPLLTNPNLTGELTYKYLSVDIVAPSCDLDTRA